MTVFHIGGGRSHGPRVGHGTAEGRACRSFPLLHQKRRANMSRAAARFPRNQPPRPCDGLKRAAGREKFWMGHGMPAVRDRRGPMGTPPPINNRGSMRDTMAKQQRPHFTLTIKHQTRASAEGDPARPAHLRAARLRTCCPRWRQGRRVPRRPSRAIFGPQTATNVGSYSFGAGTLNAGRLKMVEK